MVQDCIAFIRNFTTFSQFYNSCVLLWWTLLFDKDFICHFTPVKVRLSALHYSHRSKQINVTGILQVECAWNALCEVNSKELIQVHKERELGNTFTFSLWLIWVFVKYLAEFFCKLHVSSELTWILTWKNYQPTGQFPGKNDAWCMIVS